MTDPSSPAPPPRRPQRPAPSDAPHLFDRGLRAKRRERAAQTEAFAALHRLIAERLAERLDDTPFVFERAAILGGAGGVYYDAIAGRPGLSAVDEIDAAPSLAQDAAAAGGALCRRVFLGDPAAPALEPGVYDLVVCPLELHAADDPLGALIQMRRLLKPNGFLLACFFAGETLRELRAALSAAEGGPTRRVAPFGVLQDLGGLLQRAGFALPVADVERMTVRHADPVALMRDLRAIGETFASPPPHRGLSRATLGRLIATSAAPSPSPSSSSSSWASSEDGRVASTVEIAFLTGWRPGPGQPAAKRPGSATARLADALGVTERPAGEKAPRGGR